MSLKKTTLITSLAAVVLLSWSVVSYSHCQIPCGIYDDAMRIGMILEDIGTIEKSMTKITALSQAKPTSQNQLIRWVTNKDTHAEKIQQTVWQYFMAQRIKPAVPEKAEAYSKYVKQITLLHQMIVAAMKCKQTTDLAHTTNLKSLTAQFEKAYFGPEGRRPTHKH